MAASAVLLLAQVNRSGGIAAGYAGSLPPGGPDPFFKWVVRIIGTIAAGGLLFCAFGIAKTLHFL